jgi:PAS domain S-box-containing protein
MKTKIEQFPAMNPNPVISVERDGTVLYSNKAGEPLLYEWNAKVGDKLPSFIVDFVKKAILINSPEKMEVNVGNSVYLVAFHSFPEEGQVNIYGFDISDQKKFEGKLKMELAKCRQSDKELLKAYEQIRTQSQDLQVFNEELQSQSEELRITNEALQESERRFRTLAENSPDAIARFDRQNRHTYVNPAAAKVYGHFQEEMIGKTLGELKRDPAQVRLLETYFEIVFATGKPEKMKYQYTSPTGNEYYFSVRIVPEFVDGKVISILTISHDITDIKNAETKLKKTYDNLENLVKERTVELEKAYNSLKESQRSLAEAQEMAHIGNWEWDIATDKAYWSDEMYRIFKRDPQKSAPSFKEYLSYIHPDDLNYYCKVNDYTKKVCTSGLDFRIVLANGEQRTLHIKSEFIFNDENIPIRVKGIVQDITGRKEAEEAMAKIEIVRKQEIHHRIKNNLQVISSLLDLQAEKFKNREDIKDSEVLEAFRESQDRVISMALIHEELHKGGEIDTLDFSSYIEELAENLFSTYRVGSRDISLNLDLEKNLSFDLDTAVPLGMIVNELVSNSFKHAFPGRDKGEIRIKLFREKAVKFENEDRESTSFTLTVSDNGVGIPELDIENLNSLGMQLVITLVDQLDGKLELKRNNGTEFIIRFKVTEKYKVWKLSN